MKGVTWAAVAFFIALSLIAYSVRDSHPALLRLPFHRNAVAGAFNHVILNPFRDRTPERKGSEYLQTLSRGDCKAAATMSVAFKFPNEMSCEQFIGEHRGYVNEYSFPLRDVTRSRTGVLLYYSKTGYQFTSVSMTKPAGQRKVDGFEKFW